MTGDNRGPRAELVYSEVRDRIQDGDIILFQGKSLLSAAIRLFTGSRYSHAGIAAWWHGRLLILEAVGQGIWAVPLSWRLATYKGRAELWTTQRALDRVALLSAAKTELGKTYARWLLVRIARKIVFGLKREADPWKPPRRFVCSQYVSYVYREGGLDLTELEPDQFTTPQHIAESDALQCLGRLTTQSRGDDSRYSDGPDK